MSTQAAIKGGKKRERRKLCHWWKSHGFGVRERVLKHSSWRKKRRESHILFFDRRRTAREGEERKRPDRSHEHPLFFYIKVRRGKRGKKRALEPSNFFLRPGFREEKRKGDALSSLRPFLKLMASSARKGRKQDVHLSTVDPKLYDERKKGGREGSNRASLAFPTSQCFVHGGRKKTRVVPYFR